MTSDLFAGNTATSVQPLSSRMRPESLDQFFGQEHLLAPGKPLREALENGLLHSMVFWGPPGVGKTTLAQMMAQLANARFTSLSAVLAGVKDIRAAVATAEQALQQSGRKTILFVDEVHRFNKAQQDAFLPYVENGTITFVGATTENPSFELNNALLSRCRVYLLRNLDQSALAQILRRALVEDANGLGQTEVSITDEAMAQITLAADGDARKALNMLEIAGDMTEADTAGHRLIDQQVVAEVLSADVRRFDKSGEAFYDQISALHKSVRGSAPDAALYWFARMLDGGCDPLYIARRVVRMASEDIGNADPRALQLALNAWEVQERLGSPEGELAIAQALCYLAAAPKSNAVYNALNSVMADVKQLPSYDVPLHLRNAPTELMKTLDYGASYRYPHDEVEGYAAGEQYFPEPLADRQYYLPVARGLKIKIAEKLEQLRQRDLAHEAGVDREQNPSKSRRNKQE